MRMQPERRAAPRRGQPELLSSLTRCLDYPSNNPSRRTGSLRTTRLDQSSAQTTAHNSDPRQAWPSPGLTRVPYRVFQKDETYEKEQERIFQGPLWHYLCMEIEIPVGGDFRTTKVGDTPVVVSRDHDGEIYAFDNR